MTDIVYPEIEDYLKALAAPRDEVLVEMESYASEHGIPIVGPVVGAFLFQLTHAKGARRIFELGSAIGYSTIWLARGAGNGSEVFYTDSSEDNADLAKSYFTRAGVTDRISMKTGDALDLFDATGGDFDLIFNDVDKHDYPRVFAKALPRLRKGGYLITDNVLWSGKVARSAARDDRSTQAIQEYNRLAAEAQGCVYSVVPLRDGVGVLLKVS
jgi:predicted O-methyltransferase YrrM